MYSFFQNRPKCNVNPETDFRPEYDSSLHADQTSFNKAHAAMHGFEHLQIQDGLWLNWTDSFYSYEDKPSCPDCGNSPFLYCDKDLDPRYPSGVCVSKTKEFCAQRKRRTTIDQEDELSRPAPHCQSVNKHRGLPGDGRSRDTPLERCEEILRNTLISEAMADERMKVNAG